MRGARWLIAGASLASGFACGSTGPAGPINAVAGGAGGAEMSVAGSVASAGSSSSGAGLGGSAALAGASGAVSPAGGNAGGGGSTSSSSKITVSAGELDRQRTITVFKLAGEVGKSCVLTDEQGASLPLQVGSDGSATFILPELLAGEERTYTVTASSGEAAVGATSVAGAKDVKLAIGAAQVVRFQAQSELPGGVAAVYARGGYLHPLYSPRGVVVTGDYPASHIHHHGVWSAWTRAQFNGHAIDCWNMADGKGKVDFDKLGELWQGPVHAGFEADLAHIDLLGPAPVTALTEHWKVTVYKTHDALAPYLVFDLESLQKTASDKPVELEEYIYGGFGMRGNEEWLDKSKVTFRTSEGADRLGGDAKPARWVFIGGSVGGKTAGFAVLGHPENFRAPQPLRLHPDEPYASISPPKAGAFSIQPGMSYVTRFRIVTVDGAPDAALFDALWNDYATPPAVRVE